MRGDLNRRSRCAICALALLGAWSCRVAEPAPPAPLRAALQTFITDSLRPQTVASGRRFSVEADTDGVWARALATAPPPSAARQPTLDLHLGRAEMHGDSAAIHARLVSCTPSVSGMNFSVHTIRLRFLQEGGA
jgi:hypothetical protein